MGEFSLTCHGQAMPSGNDPRAWPGHDIMCFRERNCLDFCSSYSTGSEPFNRIWLRNKPPNPIREEPAASAPPPAANAACKIANFHLSARRA